MRLNKRLIQEEEKRTQKVGKNFTNKEENFNNDLLLFQVLGKRHHACSNR